MLTLEIGRVLRARPSVIFRAFSDPDELAKWWGPHGFSTPSLELHARVGEGYRIEMQPPQGAPFYLSGEFRAVDPPARLAYTFAWEDPDPDDLDTLVDLSFRDVGASTEVALRQGPFGTEARRRLHRDGWADSFDKLERLLRAAQSSHQSTVSANPRRATMAPHPEHQDRPASFHTSPAEASKAPPEELLYLACLHEGTGVKEPDFLAVVDAEDGRIVHELPMPNVGDELHHFGWNRCSSACHGPDRSHLIVPGFRSSRIHVVNVADDPRRPRLETVIERDELVRATGLTRPHTVHCMPGENIVISMLGDADGNGACGFAALDARTFEVKGRWENGGPHPPFNYDFWYQPRQNVLASSEFGEPNAYERGFDLDDVAAGRYGSRLHFWNLSERRLEQTLELGETGLVPLEVRWLHDPDADEGFVGAALSSTMWHFHRENGSYRADKVIAVDGIEQEGWPFPVPGLITDLVVSMDDRFLYFSNWLQGDLRQYDISDPSAPKLTGQLQLGGVLGRPSDAGRDLGGGPQMLQLSLDGRRLYVTNSLYSTWDNQFYPGLRSWLLRIDCAPDGGMEVDRDFFVDFHDRPEGPARAHEARLQGGDCTTEIFQ
jgi:selenium-binding protein 1